MPDSTRIFMVTPSDVHLVPATERIVRYSPRGAAPRSGPPTDDFSRFVQGSATGELATDVLLDEIDGQNDDASVLLFPLVTYDWAYEVRSLPPRVLAMLPGIGRGLLMAVPWQWLPDLQGMRSDAEVHKILARIEDRQQLLRIVVTRQPVADPVHPFVSPMLSPDARGKPAWRKPPYDRARLAEIEGETSSPTAVRAGIAQMHDLLDESHNLAQSIEGHPDGDYWHAIMHRREPDYGNSKYWFRHVGRHPVFAQLGPRAAEILNEAPVQVRSTWASKLKVDSSWDPFAFVDMCEAAARDEDSPLGLTARRIQWLEMLLLLKHCARCSDSPQL